MAAVAGRLAEYREDAEARLAQSAAALVVTETKLAESESAREHVVSLRHTTQGAGGSCKLLA